VQPFLDVDGPGGRQLRPVERERITIGRGVDNDVTVDDPEASRRHAIIEQLGAASVVRDLSSRNGTWINGVRLSGDRPLKDGDEVRVGSTRIVYRGGPDGGATATVGSDPPPTLTPREREVLVELFRPALAGGTLAEPASTREISGFLSVSEAAVKQHLFHLYEKFGIHSGLDRRRLRLANEALRRGAVTMADVRARVED
jgi:DNA-binding CsgD family transcriptional regulator